MPKTAQSTKTWFTLQCKPWGQWTLKAARSRGNTSYWVSEYEGHLKKQPTEN